MSSNVIEMHTPQDREFMLSRKILRLIQEDTGDLTPNQVVGVLYTTLSSYMHAFFHYDEIEDEEDGDDDPEAS